MSLNPVTNILYVTNEYFHTITEIYNNTQSAGIFFSIKPSIAGYLTCNQTKIQDNDYLRYAVGLVLDCVAKPNSQFAFSSFSGDLAYSSNPTSNNRNTANVSLLHT